MSAAFTQPPTTPLPATTTPLASSAPCESPHPLTHNATELHPVSDDSPAHESVHDSMPDQHMILHLADIFSLLGDQGRIKILCALQGGPLKVRDIASATHQSQSSVSHSLRLLRAHQVVSVERVGREAFYELADHHVRSLLELALTHIEHEH